MSNNNSKTNYYSHRQIGRFSFILIQSSGSSVNSSGQLTDNARGAYLGGTQNRIGDLGWYYFMVDSSLIGQTLSFGLSNVYVLNGNVHNVNVNLTSSQFSVVPEPVTFLLLGLGGFALRQKH